jgi:hypothetical protein
VQQNLVQRRLLELLLGFGNDPAIQICIVVVFHNLLTRLKATLTVFHTAIEPQGQFHYEEWFQAE